MPHDLLRILCCVIVAVLWFYLGLYFVEGGKIVSFKKPELHNPRPFMSFVQKISEGSGD